MDQPNCKVFELELASHCLAPPPSPCPHAINICRSCPLSISGWVCCSLIVKVPTVQTVLLTCSLKRGCTILHSQLARSYCVGEINWTSLQYISMVMKCWFYCPQANNLVNHKGTTTFCFRIPASHQGLSLRFLHVGGPAIVVQPHVFQCFNSQHIPQVLQTQDTNYAKDFNTLCRLKVETGTLLSQGYHTSIQWPQHIEWVKYTKSRLNVQGRNFQSWMT